MKMKFSFNLRKGRNMAYKTKQSEIVLEYLKENSDSHLTANEIAMALSGKNVGKTTVYRHLEKLCRDGAVRKYILEEGDTRELSKIFFDKIPVIQVDFPTNEVFEKQLLDIQEEYTKSKAIEIDTMIFDLYNLSKEERQLIGFVEIE